MKTINNKKDSGINAAMKRHENNRPDIGSSDFLVKMAEALKVWPDPTLAPEVPPEFVLQQYLKNPKALSPELTKQISEDINCLRELARLRASASDKTLPEADFVQKLKDSLPETSGKIKTNQIEPLLMEDFPCPGSGQIWTTTSRVESLDRGKSVWRWTFHPQLVLLLSAPKDHPWGDTTHRVVPVTPIEVWPEEMLGDDEMIIALPKFGKYAVHLWLAGDTSAWQLENYLGELPESELEAVVQELEALCSGGEPVDRSMLGIPLDPELDHEVMIERQRQQWRCSWLWATAECRKQMGLIPERISPTTLPFSLNEERSLAAANNDMTPLMEATYTVEGMDVKMKTVTSCDGKHWCFQIFDRHGNISRILDGAVLSTSGGASSPFRKGQTMMAVAKLRKGFRLRTIDDNMLTILLES